MKNIKNNNPKLDVFRDSSNMFRKFKVTAVSAGLTTFICLGSFQSIASDIEIYKMPDSTASSGVVMMMLDTSGSMDRTQVGISACDFSEDYLYSNIDILANRANATFGTRPYSRAGCTVTGRKLFRYIRTLRYVNGQLATNSWARCGSNNTGTFSKNNCTQVITAPSVTELQVEQKDSNVINNNTFTRELIYYSVNNTPFTDLGSSQLDRISRLKDALYNIAISPVDDPTTETIEGIKGSVQIAIGTFPYYGSTTDNNRRAIVRVPAGTWGPVGSPQRQAVINMISDPGFRGIGGTPTSAAYAEAAAYLLGTTTGGGTYSGQNLVTDPAIGTRSNYRSPINPNSAPECSGQGIYFLTDGQPQTPTGTDTSTLMANALRVPSYSFSSGLTNNGANDGGSYKSDWAAIGSFASSLNDESVVRNALGEQKSGRRILTAVVGFGSVFSNATINPNNITDPDARNAYLWGERSQAYGKGGFLAATQANQIVANLNAFIGEVSGKSPSVSTGNSTIPLDALNPETIQPFSYFPQFEPKVSPSDIQQAWMGNLKKYYVVDNSVYASSNGGSSNLVVQNNKLMDLADIWSNSQLSYPNNTPIFSKHGALSQLKIGLQTNEKNILKPSRKLLTDYVFDGTQSQESQIGQDLNLVQIDHNYTINSKTKADPRARGLMSLLGFNISQSQSMDGLDLTKITPDIRQMGSVMHGLPILLTQSGKAVAKKENGKVIIDTDDRQDYAMFTTTQGLLHVVKASTVGDDAVGGTEEFSFVPKELVTRQSETFRVNGGSTSGGKDALYYGLDGEWVAHTVYVVDSDGSLTVKDVEKNVIDSVEKENLRGKQWVYGGMRMGGRSYYALDLTDIDNPLVKFHIDPSSGKVYSQDHKGGKEYSVLKNMGQSWSKPRLDYVNWKGERKLVMFVAGGYDAGGPDGDGLYSDNGVRTGYEGYEKYNYIQTNKKGAGVYMFDANTGDLLWYADSNENQKNGNTQGGVADSPTAHFVSDDMNYSIVSEIKTVDRNNDGVVDHIYFGDLAGQAFRADFLNDGNTNDFTTQVTKILDLHKEDGTSPRFYYAPVFTAHSKTSKVESGNIVVATFTSGNKSSPLLATEDSPTATGLQNSTGLEHDGVYAIYEYDIHPKGVNFPTSLSAVKTLDASNNSSTPDLTKLKRITNIAKTNESVTGAQISASSGWGGWYYRFDKKFDDSTSSASVIKGLTPLIAMEGNLYVTMFDASEAGTSSSCGVGVKGKSFVKRLCLPTGVCEKDAEYTYDLGAGIVNLNVGPSSPGTKSIIVPDPDNICVGENCSPCKGSDCKAGEKFLPAGGALKFIPNRWYERYARES